MKLCILVITGERGVGKSTFLEELSLNFLPEYSIGGVITLGQEQRKFLDVRTREEIPFWVEEEVLVEQIGNFKISEKALDFANSRIKEAMHSEIIFIDELGRLEAERKALFSSVKTLIHSISNSSKILILVIRKEFVIKMQKLLDFKLNFLYNFEREKKVEIAENINKKVLKSLIK